MSVVRWQALGTTVSLRTVDAEAIAAAQSAVDEQLRAIDAACSRFRADSELTHVNEAAGRWTPVGPLLAEALAVALRAAALTDGLVDPTIGEALIMAGYDRDFAAGLREPAEPIAVRRVGGWQAVRLDRERRRVRIERGIRLDLGATAKALAADRAAAVAAARSGSGVLVNLGGDIAVAGPAPEEGWTVRVTDDHRAAPDAPGQLVTLRTGGLATSSTTVRRWGDSSHHIVDPATGRPAESPWRTVSVAAASCVDANIASTAAIVRGEDAPAWLAERGLPARLVTRDGEVETVAGWPAEVTA